MLDQPLNSRSAGLFIGLSLWWSLIAFAISVVAQPLQYGDLDSDGQVTVLDLVRLNNHLNAVRGSNSPGARLLAPPLPLFADVNEDGSVNDADVEVLSDMILGNRSAKPFPFTRISESSPASGEAGVAVTREVIFRFTRPLATNTHLGVEHIYAAFGGQRLPGRVRLGSDRRAVTLFVTNDLPASARVRVTFDAFGLTDSLGLLVDLDGDGRPGGVAQVDFDTLSLTRIPGTHVWGYVFDSYNRKPDGSDRPVIGATIRVDGYPEANATTDTNGFFVLRDMPAPVFFVHVDGSTATNAPPGAVYATVGKPFHSVAGSSNQLTMDGSIFHVYLPPMSRGDLQNLSPTKVTEVHFGAAGRAELMRMFPNVNPAVWERTMVMVPPNSAQNDAGIPVTQAAIIPVPASRLPAPLPPYLNHQLDIAVIAPGASSFSEPAPCCFPNLPDPGSGQPPLPGTKRWLMSFNHDTGMWEPVGPMTVSADGLLVCSDPGVGIRAPGWHGTAQPPMMPQPCNSPCCDGTGAGGGRNLQSSSSCEPCQSEILNRRAECLEKALRNYNKSFTQCLRSERDCYIDCIPESREAVAGYLICVWKCTLKSDICKADAARDLREEVAQCATCPSESRLANASRLAALPELPNDPVIRELDSVLQLISTIALTNLNITDSNRLLSALTQTTNLLSYADQLGDGNVVRYLTQSIVGDEEQARILENVVGQAVSDSPGHAVAYAAEIKSNGRTFIVRGFTDAFGNYALFTPQAGRIANVAFYDRITKRYGEVQPRELPHQYSLPRLRLHPTTSLSDFDGDGLVDAAEFVVGTDFLKSDTDGDGILDGVEVESGTDPLDGRPVRTGIIAAGDTAGTAIDICAVNNIAIVADGDAGVTVFNVLAGANPVRVAQVDTPGYASAVSCSGNLIAVADGAAGLGIIDITDPPAARIVRRIPFSGSAQAVVASGGIAFVGTTAGDLASVEMETGVVLQRVSLNSAVHDVAIEGSTLYCLLGEELRTFDLSQFALQYLGSTSVSGHSADSLAGRKRLFVGGGYAYAASSPGFDRIDVSNPSAMRRVGSAQFGGPASFKQIVANGSGLGVAAVGVTAADNTHDIYLYDLSNPANTTAFLTLLPTPDIARAVSIYNGLAYVADSAAGMEVVNYLPYDSRGIPPSGTLSVTATNNAVPEGGLVFVRAVVADDVQVRSVEFFVNGQRAVIDGNFPFEHGLRLPPGNVGGTVTLSAVASDTGGNTTNLGPIQIVVTPDSLPPLVTVRLPEQILSLAGDQLALRVDAADNVGIELVTFLIDGQIVTAGRKTIADYVISLPVWVGLGRHNIRVVVRDFAGHTTTSAPVEFTISAEAMTRELTVFNFGEIQDRDSLTRELTVFSYGAEEIHEAITRELTVFSFGSEQPREAITREFSLFNFGADERREAISRELTAYQFGLDDSREAITRELSVFSFGPAQSREAMTREMTLFNFGFGEARDATSREISVERKNP